MKIADVCQRCLVWNSLIVSPRACFVSWNLYIYLIYWILFWCEVLVVNECFSISYWFASPSVVTEPTPFCSSEKLCSEGVLSSLHRLAHRVRTKGFRTCQCIFSTEHRTILFIAVNGKLVKIWQSQTLWFDPFEFLHSSPVLVSCTIKALVSCTSSVRCNSG